MATNVGSKPAAGQVERPGGEALPRGIHLVGSVPLASADEVFRAVGAALGDHVRRIPDGETGPRSDWIVWQYPVLSSRPQFEVVPPARSEERRVGKEGRSARSQNDENN